MKLIVCLDNQNGMQFHHRRQSSDVAVCKRMLELAGDCNLFMNSCSGYLFAGLTGNIQIRENFLEKAGPDDFCFLENNDVLPYLHTVSKVYVFRWNRDYPADIHFPAPLVNGQVIEEFAGNSHERITLEVYSYE